MSTGTSPMASTSTICSPSTPKDGVQRSVTARPQPDPGRMEVDGRDHAIGPHGHASYRGRGSETRRFPLTSASASPTLQGRRTDREAELNTITPAFKHIASGLRFPEGPVAMPDGSVVL